MHFFQEKEISISIETLQFPYSRGIVIRVGYFLLSLALRPIQLPPSHSIQYSQKRNLCVCVQCAIKQRSYIYIYIYIYHPWIIFSFGFIFFLFKEKQLLPADFFCNVNFIKINRYLIQNNNNKKLFYFVYL